MRMGENSSSIILGTWSESIKENRLGFKYCNVNIKQLMRPVASTYLVHLKGVPKFGLFLGNRTPLTFTTTEPKLGK